MSKDATDVEFVCTKETFKPVSHDIARWLDQDEDFHLVRAWMEEQRFPNGPLSQEEWDEWHKDCQFCAVLQDGKIASIAHAWKASESTWIVAGVYTKEGCRCRGYAKAVCSLVTSYILSYKSKAICVTKDRNIPMIRVLESLGFQTTRPL